MNKLIYESGTVHEGQMITIKDGTDHISQVRDLIIEYTKRLNRDLSFQNIAEELEDPAVKYTAPEGELLVAVDESDHVLGMVAYHRHNCERCEMKRLYITPRSRGMHAGDLLVEKIVEHARQAGYKEMVLDTIIPLRAAIGLYKKHGFQECEPYYDNPMDDVIYMKIEL